LKTAYSTGRGTRKRRCSSHTDELGSVPIQQLNVVDEIFNNTKKEKEKSQRKILNRGGTCKPRGTNHCPRFTIVGQDDGEFSLRAKIPVKNHVSIVPRRGKATRDEKPEENRKKFTNRVACKQTGGAGL